MPKIYKFALGRTIATQGTNALAMSHSLSSNRHVVAVVEKHRMAVLGGRVAGTLPVSPMTVTAEQLDEMIADIEGMSDDVRGHYDECTSLMPDADGYLAILRLAKLGLSASAGYPTQESDPSLTIIGDSIGYFGKGLNESETEALTNAVANIPASWLPEGLTPEVFDKAAQAVIHWEEDGETAKDLVFEMFEIFSAEGS